MVDRWVVARSAGGRWVVVDHLVVAHDQDQDHDQDHDLVAGSVDASLHSDPVEEAAPSDQMADDLHDSNPEKY